MASFQVASPVPAPQPLLNSTLLFVLRLGFLGQPCGRPISGQEADTVEASKSKFNHHDLFNSDDGRRTSIRNQVPFSGLKFHRFDTVLFKVAVKHAGLPFSKVMFVTIFEAFEAHDPNDRWFSFSRSEHEYSCQTGSQHNSVTLSFSLISLNLLLPMQTTSFSLNLDSTANGYNWAGCERGAASVSGNSVFKSKADFRAIVAVPRRATFTVNFEVHLTITSYRKPKHTV